MPFSKPPRHPRPTPPPPPPRALDQAAWADVIRKADEPASCRLPWGLIAFAIAIYYILGATSN